jgi:hypothetical protein
MAFPSVYEMFVEDLTTVRKQHFWEYFSGATLNSRWTTGNTGSGGSGAMADSVDGGYKMSSAYNNSLNGIHFNDKRQFSPTASVCILLLKRQTATSSNDAVRGGFVNTFTGSTNYAYVQDNESATYKTLKTADGSTEYSANSTIAVDTDWHTYKIEMKSSSIDWSIDGVVQTSVSNVPQSSTKLQPMSAGGNLTTANGTPEGRIKYMECYNT